MSLLYRYSRDIHRSQDLLQETFVLIFRKLGQFNVAKGTFESWTSKIAINTYLQDYRKKNFLHYQQVPELATEDGEMSTIEKMTVKEIRVAISKLSEADSTILNLYYFEEYSHKEIAELFDIEISSSRSKLSRARKILSNYWSTLNTITSYEAGT
jgi:RNA polymerase sigma-70 factor (ECF subfamily)